MTRKHTGDEIKEGYGLGWAVNGHSFGHGGAFATDMAVDSKCGPVTVFLVQHAGFPGNGGQSLAAFRKAAESELGGPRH
jgi:CubicO group peptidase (beta-lactamase class C family)